MRCRLAECDPAAMYLLLVSVIALFFRRGNYVLLPILILLLILGLVLYFVQSSALSRRFSIRCVSLPPLHPAECSTLMRWHRVAAGTQKRGGT